MLTKAQTRAEARKRPANITFLRLPHVQPVHGRNCICHACAPRKAANRHASLTANAPPRGPHIRHASPNEHTRHTGA